MAGAAIEPEAWWTAVWGGDVAAVRDLLQLGALPSWRDASLGADDVTALIAAANLGNTALIALLLQAGADVDTRSESGWTPLMRACDTGALEAAQLLLDAGADVNARNDEGYTALGRVPRNCPQLLALL